MLLIGWSSHGGPSVSPHSTNSKYCRTWTLLLTFFFFVWVCSPMASRWREMSGRATQTTVWILMAPNATKMPFLPCVLRSLTNLRRPFLQATSETILQYLQPSCHLLDSVSFLLYNVHFPALDTLILSHVTRDLSEYWAAVSFALSHSLLWSVCDGGCVCFAQTFAKVPSKNISQFSKFKKKNKHQVKVIKWAFFVINK